MNPPRFFGPQELAKRWAVTRQRVNQLDIPGGERLASGNVWTAEEVAAFEAANPEWTSPEAIAARTASLKGGAGKRRRPSP